MSKTLHIFKTGTHISMGGSSLTFSESDLAATIAAYDPALHEAPIVVGHPKHDLPAYGWIKSLSLQPDGLYAEPQQVDPAFAEMHSAGRFKKKSAAFYPPDSPNNPKPGIFYLRHVGFLGAEPPAVKGLRDSAFADDGADFVTIEFSEATEEPAGLVQKLLELLTRAVAAPAAPAMPVQQFAEPKATTTKPTEKEIAVSKELQEQLSAAEEARKKAEGIAAEATKQLAAFAESNKKQAEAANLAFAEDQVKAGRVLPKDSRRTTVEGAFSLDQASLSSIRSVLRTRSTGRPARRVDNHVRAIERSATAPFLVAEISVT